MKGWPLRIVTCEAMPKDAIALVSPHATTR
jgi:hypothetical protein